MVSITSPTHLCFPQKPISRLNIPSVLVVLNAKKGAGIRRKVAGFKIFVGKRSDFFRFLEVGRGKFWESCWCCWCKGSWESEGDSDLEADILDFMENSSKPGAFPSKNELVEAGRLDLVEAIKSKGGWLSLGWESEEGHEGETVKEDEILRMKFDIKDFQKRVERCRESDSSEETEPGSWPPSSARNSPMSDDSSASSNHSASSSDRSLEIGFEEDSGIDGILSRLEKERSSSFGINLRISKYRTHTLSKDTGDRRQFATSRDVDRIDPEKNSRLTSASTNEGRISSPDVIDKPDTWRNWSLHRAGFYNAEFEAAEISFSENRVENRGESSKDEIIVTAADAVQALDKWKGTICNKHIQTRLQHLELDIASALHSLRSKSAEINSKVVLANSSSDLQTLADALEFQENELTSSQERLRSIRAKLAVLEGKMALAIMNAQKILEEKQTRISSACKTLKLLCTACIIWPNSASEVLLAGSFDGWTTQRKMEKSRTGIFSVCLKLYPGRHEIKFIVDGQWRIDPLRPIVHNNGYENNLLMIT